MTDFTKTNPFINFEYSARLSVGYVKGCWDSAGGFYSLAKGTSLHPSEVIFSAINGTVDLNKMIWSKD